MSTEEAVDNDWTAEGSGDPDEAYLLDVLARRLPRAELHMHLTGALRRSLVGGGTDASRTERRWDYTDVPDFFARHHGFAAGLDTVERVRAATVHALGNAVDTGCRHVELSVNHAEIQIGGLPTAAFLDAVGAAFAELSDRTGLSGGIVFATDRNSGPDMAMDGLAGVIAARERGVSVLGIGNDGSPSRALGDFAAVFARARDAGLRTTAHANKAQDVLDVLELGLDRIDHAWELGGRPDLQRRVADAGTPVTMALSSCLVMLPGLFPAASAFPFQELRDAGVRVSLHTDDPAMFHTDSAQEYRLASRTWGWDRQIMAAIAAASLDAAWLATDDPRREDWRRETAALIRDPRGIPKHAHEQDRRSA